MTRSHRLPLIELHSLALLFGLTGLFGKFIHASPLLLTGQWSPRSVRQLDVLLASSGGSVLSWRASSAHWNRRTE